jgi:hypothetical protein
VLTATLPSTGHSVVAYSLPQDVFTGPLPSNGCPSIVGHAFFGKCLPSRCLANGQTRHNMLVHPFVWMFHFWSYWSTCNKICYSKPSLKIFSMPCCVLNQGGEEWILSILSMHKLLWYNLEQRPKEKPKLLTLPSDSFCSSCTWGESSGTWDLKLYYHTLLDHPVFTNLTCIQDVLLYYTTEKLHCYTRHPK